SILAWQPPPSRPPPCHIFNGGSRGRAFSARAEISCGGCPVGRTADYRHEERSTMTRKFMLACAALAVTAKLGGAAFAGANDYVFEPVKPEIKKGDDVVVSVRLKHKATGKPVTDAVII